MSLALDWQALRNSEQAGTKCGGILRHRWHVSCDSLPVTGIADGGTPENRRH
jgi:hypothetical protein